MKSLQINTNPEVTLAFNRYPDEVRPQMLRLRKLILDTAAEIAGISFLEETLKWGEPGYLVQNGSTLRIDWKRKTPDQYAMYFKCTSKLVPTFKLVYGDLFNYEGNRAIVFNLTDKIPVAELKSCIAAALQYHQVKHLPDLGL